MQTHIGIDFGSKLAGTTVICVMGESGKIDFFSSVKEKDADEFITDRLLKCKAGAVFVDAPLSLPAVYAGKAGATDYFLRKADKELKARSPMALGGLTARAMHLHTKLKGQDVRFFETYPMAMAAVLDVERDAAKTSKEELKYAVSIVKAMYSLKLRDDVVKNIHFLDALLACISAKRYDEGIAQVYGDEEEGLIYV